jgi:hypothetical protein
MISWDSYNILFMTVTFVAAGVAESLYRLRLRLKDRGSILSKSYDGIFPLRQRAQTDSEAHSASYQMGTEGSYPGGKSIGE